MRKKLHKDEQRDAWPWVVGIMSVRFLSYLYITGLD